ncbi:MAG: PrsW family intramembrane metalloprotease [Candidatus Thorarchaeota archaeon]|jgi:RsiW-degrading membrane proteinase PrsW (M82 family)
MAYEELLLLLASVIPAILLMIFIYRKDSLRPENPIYLVGAFIAGFLAVGLALVIGIYVTNPIATDILTTTLNFIYYFAFLAFVSAGFVEEFVKLLFFAILIWRLVDFDEYMDGIVYMVAIAMGFAALENILFGFVYGLSVSDLLVRGVIAVPMHAMVSGPMGYFVAKAKIEQSGTMSNVLLGFLFAFIFHGLWDMLALYPIIAWFLVVYISIPNDIAYIVHYGFMILLFIIGLLGLRYFINKAKERDAGN